MDDDLIYWRGVPVAVMEGNRLVWLSTAPAEAIAELSADAHRH